MRTFRYAREHLAKNPCRYNGELAERYSWRVCISKYRSRQVITILATEQYHVG